MSRSVKFILASGLIASYSLSGAFEIDGTPPSVEFKNMSPGFALFEDHFETKMNGEVAKAFNATLDSARAQLSGFKEQKDLAQGFANANAYSVHSATLQGFQNYSLFAVASGLMVGVQAPSTSLSYLSKAAGEIQEKGDIYAGVSAGFSFVNLGINAKFLLPGLYLNAKYGALSTDIDDFSMDFSVMGLGVNYRLLEPKSLVGLIKWRGISVGTGYYMQSNKINLKVTPDSIVTEAKFREAVMAGATPGPDSTSKAQLLDEMGYTVADPNANVTLTPEFNMGLDVSTITIPFDAATSVAILFGALNLTAGVGVDLNFGSSEVILRGDSDADIASHNEKATFQPATVSIDGSSDNGPSFVRPRVMLGAGVGLGPVKIDVPVIYYFNSGAAFGLTVAVVW
jgi:hypothetical protein